MNIQKTLLLSKVFGEYMGYEPSDEEIEEALSKLTPREKYIVEQRFGDIKVTLREIGIFFGVNRERIRQIEVKALRKLRYPLSHYKKAIK